MSSFKEKYDTAVDLVDGIGIRGVGAGVLAAAGFNAVTMFCPKLRLISKVCTAVTMWFAADAVADAASRQLHYTADNVEALIEGTVETVSNKTKYVVSEEGEKTE